MVTLYIKYPFSIVTIVSSVTLLRIKWMEKLSIWQRKLFDIKNIYDFTMTAKIENFYRKNL